LLGIGNFEYAVERERGLDAVEDLYNPMTFRFDVTTRTSASIIASTDIVDVSSADALRQQEIDRRSQNPLKCPSKDDFVRTLTAAADQYIVARGDQRTVIAAIRVHGLGSRHHDRAARGSLSLPDAPKSQKPAS